MKVDVKNFQTAKDIENAQQNWVELENTQNSLWKRLKKEIAAQIDVKPAIPLDNDIRRLCYDAENGKPRKILLNKTLKSELEKLPRISEYVFSNPTTKTKYKNIKKTFSRTVTRAGIPHITFHELRHTTASRLNEKGVDILTIKEILDHADLKTTQQYTHTPRKNILDAVNILETY